MLAKWLEIFNKSPIFDFEEEVEMLAQNKKACWHFFLGGPPSRVHRMASASSPLLRQLCVEKEIVGSLKQQVFLMTFLLPHQLQGMGAKCT